MSDTIFWPNYLFFTNFSDDAEQLLSVPLGILSAENATLLAAALSSHDTGPARSLWNTEEDQPYTLDGAEVVFSGENHTNLPTNALFSHVLVVRLPWAPEPHNVMALQYNYTAPAA